MSQLFLTFTPPLTGNQVADTCALKDITLTVYTSGLPTVAAQRHISIRCICVASFACGRLHTFEIVIREHKERPLDSVLFRAEAMWMEKQGHQPGASSQTHDKSKRSRQFDQLPEPSSVQGVVGPLEQGQGDLVRRAPTRGYSPRGIA